MPELRRDPVTGGWVIFASERARRPQDLPRGPLPQTDDKDCPFCPGNEWLTPREVMHFPASLEYPGHPWSLRVVEDKYPLLTRDQPPTRYGEGMYDLMAGFGTHELLIESPVHVDGYLTFPESHVRNILLAYQHRAVELSRTEEICQILITRNTGADGGMFYPHPRSHLVALPIVPKRMMEEAMGSLRYYKFKDRCLYCDIIQQEVRDRSRLIAENEAFVACCAYAGRFPFEVVVTPRVHNAQFELIRPNEIALLAEMLKSVLTAMERCLEHPPMSFIFHSAPTPQAHREELANVSKFYHWHIEIIPKLTKTAGFEWGSGFYINPILPEEAAKYLREFCGCGLPTGPR